MRTAAPSAMTTGGYSGIPFHRGTRDLVFSGLLPVATRPNLHQFGSLKPTDDRPPLRLALPPIRSAIVLARFVFRKTTTKTPFRDSKSLRDPPPSPQESFLKSKHAERPHIRIASRREDG